MSADPGREAGKASQLRYGAVLGLVAAGTGLAVSEVVSGLLHQRVSPVGALAESIIRLTPGAVIEHVIHLVGHNDKPVLITLTLLGLFVVSAGVGALALRSLVAAQVAFVGLGIVLAMAVKSRLTPSSATYIPVIAGVATTLIVLAALSASAREAAKPRPPAPVVPPGARPVRAQSVDYDRRSFLQLSAAVAVGAIAVGAFGRVLAHGRAALDAARSKLRLHVTDPAPPDGVELGVKGIAPWQTSQDRFYRIDTALAIPQILPDHWRLRIHGMVDKEIELTYQDLLARGLQEMWLTLCCVSNEVGGNLISNAWFSGVLIADILAEAGVQDGADAVKSTSDDGWTAGTPLPALMDDRKAMLAIAMNGEPLTPEHGFPVRMVVPGLYGYVSGTKWVVDMEVTTFSDFTAFWTDRGWSPQGPIKTESRIDVPNSGDHVSAGQVAIGGVAWAQHTGIAKVEVRVDDGSWAEAKLGVDPTIDSWRQWSYVWDAPSGNHTIAVRATDRSGYTQTSQTADVIPNGATGYHTVDVSVS